jgi:hypothetical protein
LISYPSRNLNKDFVVASAQSMAGEVEERLGVLCTLLTESFAIVWK